MNNGILPGLAAFALECKRQSDADKKIRKLFSEKGQMSYAEIMTTLDLDRELVYNICDGLEEAGLIEVVDSN